jgi:RNA polymerase sigma-70 factor (ECF subfamily)
MTIPVATLRATRRSLLTRLKKWDDKEAWQRFFDTYWKLLFTVARRMGLNESVPRMWSRKL